MPLPATGHVLDPWLVAGSASYWAAVVLSFMFSDTSTSPAATPSQTVASYALVALLIAAVPLVKHLFVNGRRRRGLALGMLAAIALYVLGSPFFPQRAALCGVASGLYLATVACQMVLWGFAYASLEKTRACQNVCCTVLVACLLVLGVALLAKATTLRFVPQALNICAAATLASGKVYFSNRPHGRPRLRGRAFFAFVATRVAFGLCIGFCMQMPEHVGVGDGIGRNIGVALAVTAVVLVVYLHACDRLYTACPSLLLVGIGMVALPFLDGGIAAAVALSAGIVWLAWAVLSAAQLSDLKETCRLSELSICVVEKGALCLSVSGGALGYTVLASMEPATPSSGAFDTLVLTATCLLALVAVYVMADLVSARKEDEYTIRLKADDQERHRRVLHELADEFGLSARELEVVELLAEGYTRAYIKDTLGISEGTVKAHVAHAYQKLGVHRKDDLLTMVEARR